MAKLRIVKNDYATERKQELNRKYIFEAVMFGKDVVARINAKSLYGYLRYKLKFER